MNGTIELAGDLDERLAYLQAWLDDLERRAATETVGERIERIHRALDELERRLDEQEEREATERWQALEARLARARARLAELAGQMALEDQHEIVPPSSIPPGLSPPSHNSLRLRLEPPPGHVEDQRESRPRSIVFSLLFLAVVAAVTLLLSSPPWVPA